MKKILLYIVISLVLLAKLQAQSPQEILINGSFKKITFTDFVEELERKYPIHFFFQEQWVKSVTVDVEVRDLPLSKLLDQVFLPTLLDFSVNQQGLVFILPDKKFVHQLPDYFLDNLSSDSTRRSTESSGMEEKYLRGRQADMMETIVVGSYDKAKKGKLVIITGTITDKESGEALIGATIHIPELKRGAATDVSGSFSLAVKPGVYSAVFQYMGMEDLKGNLDIRSDGFFRIAMKSQMRTIDEVLVQSSATQKRGAKAGMENVSVKTMKKIPMLMGEKDVMKVAQMLPGIVSVGEGSAGVNVRGGNADQNLFYINEIPVYNSSHLFGFFSSINADIIDNFSIYKGQIPAEYGGRLSSVFDVETRKGHMNKFFTQGGISPVSANAEVEVPLVKEKVSLMLSGRSSYSDWILKRLNDPDLRNSQASFYDFAGALNVAFNQKNQMSIFAYNSSDDFNLNGFTKYGYGNLGASVNYLHHFAAGLKSSVSLVGSNYKFNTIEKSSASEAYKHSYELKHYEFKGNLSWLVNDHHNLKVGATGILYDLNRGNVEPYGNESLKIPVGLGSEKGLETAVFIDDNISLGPLVNLYTGFRYSMFTELGPKTVRSYYPGASFDDPNVSGSTTYAGGKSISHYSHPEFRIGADIKIRQFSSFKLSVTQMTQYLFMLSNSISIAPNDQWKLVDSHISPPKSTQYSVGYYHDFLKLGLSTSTELYYKNASNVVEYRDGADFLASPYVETTVLQGKQNAYGAEFMLSKNRGRVTGWLSYTYSRSLVTVDGEHDWGDINQGKEYPSNFDKPHVVNTFFNLEISRRFSLSANMAYNTGRPVTLPQGVYYIDEQPFVDYSGRNEYRIPDYFRLDASVKIEGNLKQKKAMHSYWTVGVYNVTGRSNANSVFFLSEEGKLHGYKYSVIGVPIFTISWNWKLGNYENN